MISVCADGNLGFYFFRGMVMRAFYRKKRNRAFHRIVTGQAGKT